MEEPMTINVTIHLDEGCYTYVIRHHCIFFKLLTWKLFMEAEAFVELVFFVEINLAAPLIRKVPLKFSDGDSFVCQFHVENEPKFCKECCTFGHNLTECSFMIKSAALDELSKKDKEPQKPAEHSEQQKPTVNRRKSATVMEVSIGKNSKEFRVTIHVTKAAAIPDAAAIAPSPLPTTDSTKEVEDRHVSKGVLAPTVVAHKQNSALTANLEKHQMNVDSGVDEKVAHTNDSNDDEYDESYCSEEDTTEITYEVDAHGSRVEKGRTAVPDRSISLEICDTVNEPVDETTNDLHMKEYEKKSRNKKKNSKAK